MADQEGLPPSLCIKWTLVVLQLLKILYGGVRIVLVWTLSEVDRESIQVMVSEQMKQFKSSQLYTQVIECIYCCAIVSFYITELSFTLFEYTFGLLIFAIIHIIGTISFLLFSISLSIVYKDDLKSDWLPWLIFVIEELHSLLITVFLCIFSWQLWKSTRGIDSIMEPEFGETAHPTPSSFVSNSSPTALSRIRGRSSAPLASAFSARGPDTCKTGQLKSSTKSKISSQFKAGSKIRESKSAAKSKIRSSTGTGSQSKG